MVLLPEELGASSSSVLCILEVSPLSSWSIRVAQGPAVTLVFKGVVTSTNIPSVSMWFHGQSML